MVITLIAHSIRSTHNVGAFFRTCDALGVHKIILSGYTPYPKLVDDSRLPYLADKITRQIHKTALGAESTVAFERVETLEEVLAKAKAENAVVVALEQAAGSLTPEACRKLLNEKFKGRQVYLLLGNEIHGVDESMLKEVDMVMEIPMLGKKESLNVSVAAGIALYELTR